MLWTHIFDVAAQLFQHLIDRNGTDWNRRRVDDLLPNIVDVLAGREIHDRIGTVLDRRVKFVEFFVDVTSNCRVSDVGVDFAFGGDADRHRLESALKVDSVCRNHHPPNRYFLADRFHRQSFSISDEFHLRRDIASAGRQNLG